MEQPIAQLTHTGVSYDEKTPLFHGVNLELNPGDFFFLTGPSGTGKSSLLRLLYLDLLPTWGSVKLFSHNSRDLSFSSKMVLRQSLGVVFQDFKLIEQLTIIDNVAIVLEMRGLNKIRSRQQACALLEWVGVEPQERYPDSLSGGEKQRIAVARAVVTRPKLLLADEPTGNIDDKSALKIMNLFEELHKIGTTIIIATHNQDWIVQFPHPVLLLQNQNLDLQEGPE